MSNLLKDRIDNALINFYLEADRDTVDELLLHETVTESERNIYAQRKKQIIFFAKALANKKKDDRLLEKVSKLQSVILSNLDKPIASLKQIIQGNTSLALYSNFENLSKEGIEEQIKDSNLIRLLEELDTEEDE